MKAKSMAAKNPKHPESSEQKQKRLIRKRERLLKDLRAVEEELRALENAAPALNEQDCNIGQAELHTDIFQEAYQQNLSIEDLAKWISMENTRQEKLSFIQYQALSADHTKKQDTVNRIPDHAQKHKERAALQ